LCGGLWTELSLKITKKLWKLDLRLRMRTRTRKKKKMFRTKQKWRDFSETISQRSRSRIKAENHSIKQSKNNQKITSSFDSAFSVESVRARWGCLESWDRRKNVESANRAQKRKKPRRIAKTKVK
jgi:hypothetical protein